MSEGKKLALIVDDDDNLRDMISMIFQEMGYATHGVENTYQAKKWLAENSPSFLFLDVMMPDGNGLDFCRWVREQQRFSSLPILVGSALKDDETVQDALEMGANDFVRKPVALEQFKEKISRLERPLGQ